MPGKHLFEYAVIRVVPRVEREEFVNAGVVMYCKSLNFLECKISFNKEKLQWLGGDCDAAEVSKYLIAFENICRGEVAASPIATLDRASRFRWLTATRSTVVQCSRVHPGLTDDAAVTLQRLLEEYVL